MGCGMGGCYSCVVRVRHDGGSALRAVVPRGPGVRRAHASSGTRWRRGTLMADLSVRIGSLHAAATRSSPRRAASATASSTPTSIDLVDARRRRGQGPVPRGTRGPPPPRIVETPAGMLNAIGLQGIGVHRFVAEKLPELRRLGATVIVNICGSTLDEYCEVARVLSDAEGVARASSSTSRARTSRKAASSSAAA